MAHIELKHYEEKIRYERTNHFATPFDMAYEAFVDLEYDKKDSRFFRENASTFVENMRSQCWAEYVPHEKEFTTRLLRMLIDREKAQLLLTDVRRQLSAFETEVLGYYLDGLTCREIAETVGRPPKAVDNAVQRIRRKVERQLSSGEISRG